MREKLRKIYEKNNASLIFLYIFLKTAYIIFGKYKRFKEETKEAINSFDEPNLGILKYKNIYRKLIVYRYIYYLMPGEYYSFDFENVPYEKRNTYITRQLTNKYYRVINARRYRKILDNKNLTYKVFKKYYKRDLICIKDIEDKKTFLKFIENKEKFIIKPFDGHSGDGIEIIKVNNFKTKEELFNYTIERIPFVAEELINQSNDLGCFHKESVNTIRVVTFQYKESTSILWTFLRTGQGDSNVDNMGASGLGALINPENGVVMTDGFDWHNKKTKVHPDSNIQFKSFQIPKWDELLKMVKELSSELSQMHCVGWDLALTDKGWVLVEGNARPQCVAVQTFSGKGYRPVFDKMYNLIKKDIDEIEEGSEK